MSTTTKPPLTTSQIVAWAEYVERTRTANAVLPTILAHVESRHQAATLTRGDDVASTWHALDALAVALGLSLDVLDALPPTDAVCEVRGELGSAMRCVRAIADDPKRDRNGGWWAEVARRIITARTYAKELTAAAAAHMAKEGAS